MSTFREKVYAICDLAVGVKTWNLNLGFGHVRFRSTWLQLEVAAMEGSNVVVDTPQPGLPKLGCVRTHTCITCA